jgi:hypothetical protein
MTKQYTLTLTEKQAQTLLQALDIYSRLRMGQWRDAFEALPVDSKAEGFCWSDWHDFLSETGEKLSRFLLMNVDGWSSHLGIFNKHTPEDSRTAWDILQVIRHRLAWERAVRQGIVQSLDSPRNWTGGDMMGVHYDIPMQSGVEPLPKIEGVGGE